MVSVPSSASSERSPCEMCGDPASDYAHILHTWEWTASSNHLWLCKKHHRSFDLKMMRLLSGQERYISPEDKPMGWVNESPQSRKRNARRLRWKKRTKNFSTVIDHDDDGGSLRLYESIIVMTDRDKLVYGCLLQRRIGTKYGGSRGYIQTVIE